MRDKRARSPQADPWWTSHDLGLCFLGPKSPGPVLSPLSPSPTRMPPHACVASGLVLPLPSPSRPGPAVGRPALNWVAPPSGEAQAPAGAHLRSLSACLAATPHQAGDPEPLSILCPGQPPAGQETPLLPPLGSPVTPSSGSLVTYEQTDPKNRAYQGQGALGVATTLTAMGRDTSCWQPAE